MHDTNLQVLRALHAWRAADKPALLATVMRTWGHGPRPFISLLALSGSGETVGSAFGGIEDELLKQLRCRDLLSDGRPPELRRYEIDKLQAQSYGWPGGGSLELLLEFSPSASSLGEMLRLIGEGYRVRRSVSIADGAVELSLEDDLPARAQPMHVSVGFGPPFRLLLIGGGVLCGHLARMAVVCGFRVTVCGDRPDTGAADGVEWMRDVPDEAVRQFMPDCNSAVIALSHDAPRIEVALLEALDTDAMYIGAIGSHRSAEALRSRLEASVHLTPEVLDRLKSPVGIYIDSQTPAEIALSIMTELVATKNGVAPPFGWTSIGVETGTLRNVVGVLADAPDF